MAPRRKRFHWDIARSRESLEAAARLRPNDGRALAELVELYRGLGHRDEARPFLERLRAVDPVRWEQEHAKFRGE